ncbi:MAG: SMP-30/gluconolactonase/LRE family protein [Verrucomicrobia bacterium]|nr:SMP-30/gluconolactonase/LRE family protein [Verrucomicrobiota bacterium]
MHPSARISPVSQWLVLPLFLLSAHVALPADSAQPRLELRCVATGSVQAVVHGQTGRNYLLQTATNLASPIQWAPVAAVSMTNSVCLLSPAASADAARFYRLAVCPTETLARFAPPNLPEGVAVDCRDNIFVSLPLTGEIRKVAPDGTETSFAQLPAMVAGLTVEADGNVFVGVSPVPPNPAQHGVWKITPAGAAALFAQLPPDTLVNDVVFDAQGVLFATDSIGGRIYRLSATGQATVWLADPLLVGAPNPQPPHPAFPIGANGLVFVGTNAFVCNTDFGTVVRVPVNPDSSAGNAEVFTGDARLGGADGLKADVQGNLYVANVIQSLIVRVTPQRQFEVLASALDGLDSPSSLCFGRTPAQRTTLYLVNYATISASIPGGNPKPSLMQMRVDTPGLVLPCTVTLATFVPPNLPEGLTVDGQGNAYVSMALTGEIRKIAPDDTQSTLAQLSPMVTGLTVDASNNVFVGLAALSPPDPTNHGVWRIQPDGSASRFAALPMDSLPNDVVFGPGQMLYVTDTIGGRIFRIDNAGTATAWVFSTLLLGAPNPQPPHPAFPIGANGLAFVGTNAFVCNTDLGTLVRVPVNLDGTAGTPEIFTGGPLLGGADGLKADANGNLYVANVAQSTLLRVSPQGAIETLATALDDLDSPSSLCFGPEPRPTMLYLVNYATISASIPGGNPKPSLMRLDVGMPGRP